MDVPNIKALREMAGLTQFELATKSEGKVSRMRLSLAECGQVDLSEEEDRALRAVLKETMKRRIGEMQGILAAAV